MARCRHRGIDRAGRARPHRAMGGGHLGRVRPGGGCPPPSGHFGGGPPPEGCRPPGVPPPAGNLGVDGRIGDGWRPGRRRGCPHRVAGRQYARDQRACRCALLELPSRDGGTARGPRISPRPPGPHRLRVTDSRLRGLASGPERAQKRARRAAFQPQQGRLGRADQSGGGRAPPDPPTVGAFPLRPPWKREGRRPR